MERRRIQVSVLLRLCARNVELRFELASKNKILFKLKKKEIYHALGRTVRKVLQNNHNVRNASLRSRPPLTKLRNKPRLQFAKKLLWNWKETGKMCYFRTKFFFILMDHVDFAIIGPTCEKIKLFFSKHQFRGGSVMVWAGISSNGTTPIVFTWGCRNLESYKDMIAEKLLTEAHLITGGDCFFQQDNASCHVSRASRSWFKSNSVQILDWSRRSPDLNPHWDCVWYFSWRSI